MFALGQCLSYAVLFYYVVEKQQPFAFGETCQVNAITFECRYYQYCCDLSCCNEFYTKWYIWVLFIGLLLFCCALTMIIRKKKQQKNRLTRSLFLAHLREQRDREIAQEQQHTLPHVIFNEPVVSYHVDNQRIGIGGSSPNDFGMAPINSTHTPTHLFMNQAPPPYSPRNESRDNNTPNTRNELPPSYDSIFS